MTSLPTPTTTYHFSVTTTEHASWDPALTNTPTVSPTVEPFQAASKCCNRWSQYPLAPPSGKNASCVITNDGCTNHDAFWDLYDCCKGAQPRLLGESDEYMCTGTCEAVGQSWQELMSCLQKRAPVVVCKPDDAEIGSISSSSEFVWEHSATATGTDDVEKAEATGTSAESSNKAARSTDMAHVKNVKFGLVAFLTLALGSAAGMLI